MSKLPTGTESQTPTVSAKIQNLFTQDVNERRDSLGWEIRIHPGKNAIIVNMPAIAGEDDEQWAVGLGTGGWARWSGLPMTCAEAWHGSLYFGTDDGRICVAEGNVDNNQLTGSDNATAIPWALLTSYQNLGNAMIKRVQMVKPHFITDGTSPTYVARARYDFDLSEPVEVSFTDSPTAGTWDSSAWDSGIWGAGTGTAGQYSGSAGWGSNVAIELSGSSKAQTTLAGFDVFFDVGGLL